MPRIANTSTFSDSLPLEPHMSSNARRKLILVIGATGAQGMAVIDHLLAPCRDGRPSPYAVRAFTRDPSSRRAQDLARRGIECVKGDVSSPDTLREWQGSEPKDGLSPQAASTTRRASPERCRGSTARGSTRTASRSERQRRRGQGSAFSSSRDSRGP